MWIYQYPLIKSKNMKDPRNSSIGAVFQQISNKSLLSFYTDHQQSSILWVFKKKKTRKPFSDFKKSKHGDFLEQYRRLMGGEIPTKAVLLHKENLYQLISHWVIKKWPLQKPKGDKIFTNTRMEENNFWCDTIF